MAIQSNFPAIKPTLLLDFANTEQLDPRITFTRASTGTYYDGKTVAKAEENLFVRSQEFESSSWVKNGSSATANTATAPDGTATADSLIESSTTSEHYATSPAVAFTSGLDYTMSCFVKPNGRTWFRLSFPSTAFPSSERFAYFDVQNGVLGTVATNVTATITSAGNGWYRCAISRVATASATANTFVVICDADNNTSYTGNDTSGLYLWGAQLEQRSSVTAYTATTTQPITNYIPVLLTAASGVARFEHNPTTGESLGLEIEESRTNLLTYSEQFDNAAWLKLNATVTANAVVAPDGTLTGDKWFEDTANSAHQLQQPSTYTSGTTYTYSFYAKKGERSIITMYENILQGIEYAKFNLDTGVATNLGVPIGWTRNAISMSPVGNGWYRCVVTATPGSNVTNSAFITRMRLDNGTTTTYTGNGYSGIYIWGAQLEAGAFATSYIPTVASQVTRAADAASMTGANFSSWFNNAEGSLYAETATQYSGTPTALRTVANIRSSNDTNRFSIRFGTNATERGGSFFVFSNSTTSAFINNGTALVAGQNMKFAGAYAVNDFAFAKDAALVGTDTDGVLPTDVSELQIGASALCGTIKKLAYYPARVTNAQLQALTS